MAHNPAVPKDDEHFLLWGYPLGEEEPEGPLRLKETTVVGNVAVLRKLAEFFTQAAIELEAEGVLSYRHFCDFASVPAEQQRLADIIVAGPR
jgi:hypothetical protein